MWWESTTGQLYIWYDDGTSAQWVPATVGVPGPPGPAGPAGEGGGTEILSGVGVPADALGAVDDYYVDETGNALYGPKSTGASYGPAQHAIPAAQAPNPGFNHSTIEIGSYIKATAKGEIVAIRYWRESSTTQIARTVSVWTTTGSRLVSKSVANDGGGATSGWKEVTLDAPVLLNTNDTVVVSVGNTHDYARKDSATLPVSDGGDVTLMQGVYGLTLDVFPTTAAPSINFFVDVVFRKETGGPWPVAVKGGVSEAPNTAVVHGRQGSTATWKPVWIQLTQAAYDALTPKDANTLYVVVG
jgi:hypothetical protein